MGGYASGAFELAYVPLDQVALPVQLCVILAQVRVVRPRPDDGTRAKSLDITLNVDSP